MGATRDFVSATVADAMLPAFRRPVEDIIYETLDRRQVPTRTDFKEMRDLLNNLRGQVSGAANGIRKVVERAEETEDLLDQLETKFSAIEERMVRLEKIVESAGQVAKRLAAVEAASISAESIEQKIEARLEAFRASLPAALTAEQLDARLAQLPQPAPAVTPEQLDAAIGALPAGVTPAQLDEKLAGYVTPEQLDETLAAQAPAGTASLTPEPEPEAEDTSGPELEDTSDLCKVDGCNSKGRARGFCARHYQRWRRGTLDEPFVGLEGTVTIEGVSIMLDPGLAGEAYRVEDGMIHVGERAFPIPAEE